MNDETILELLTEATRINNKLIAELTRRLTPEPPRTVTIPYGHARLDVHVGNSVHHRLRGRLPVGTTVQSEWGYLGEIEETGTRWDDDAPYPRWVPHAQAKHPVTVVSFPLDNEPTT